MRKGMTSRKVWDGCVELWERLWELSVELDGERVFLGHMGWLAERFGETHGWVRTRLGRCEAFGMVRRVSWSHWVVVPQSGWVYEGWDDISAAYRFDGPAVSDKDFQPRVKASK